MIETKDILLETREEKSIDKYPMPVTIDKTKIILEQMEKCICKIINGKETGSGFFCLIPYNNKELKVIITNNHVLDQNILSKKKYLEVIINNNNKKIIKLNNKKIYTSKEYDITIIEIDSKCEKIEKYLKLDEGIVNENVNNILNEKDNVYILHYPNINYNTMICVSYGIITGIPNKYQMIHCCNTSGGSSGSPILKMENNKIIGIHIGSLIKQEGNAGRFLNYSIKEYINNINIIKKDNENMEKEEYFSNNNNINLIENNEIYEKNENLNNKIIDNNMERKFNNKINQMDFNSKNEYSINNNTININEQMNKNNQMNNFNKMNMNINNTMNFMNINNINYINNKNEPVENNNFKDDIKDPKDINIMYKEPNGNKLFIFQTSLGLKVNMYVSNIITINDLIKTYLKEVGLDENYVKKFIFLYNGSELDIYSKSDMLFKDMINYIIVFDPENIIINKPLNINFITPSGLNINIKV